MFDKIRDIIKRNNGLIMYKYSSYISNSIINLLSYNDIYQNRAIYLEKVGMYKDIDIIYNINIIDGIDKVSKSFSIDKKVNIMNRLTLYKLLSVQEFPKVYRPSKSNLLGGKQIVSISTKSVVMDFEFDENCTVYVFDTYRIESYYKKGPHQEYSIFRNGYYYNDFISGESKLISDSKNISYSKFFTPKENIDPNFSYNPTVISYKDHTYMIKYDEIYGLITSLNNGIFYTSLDDTRAISIYPAIYTSFNLESNLLLPLSDDPNKYSLWNIVLIDHKNKNEFMISLNTYAFLSKDISGLINDIEKLNTNNI